MLVYARQLIRVILLIRYSTLQTLIVPFQEKAEAQKKTAMLPDLRFLSLSLSLTLA